MKSYQALLCVALLLQEQVELESRAVTSLSASSWTFLATLATGKEESSPSPPPPFLYPCSLGETSISDSPGHLQPFEMGDNQSSGMREISNDVLWAERTLYQDRVFQTAGEHVSAKS